MSYCQYYGHQVYLGQGRVNINFKEVFVLNSTNTFEHAKALMHFHSKMPNRLYHYSEFIQKIDMS